MSVFAKNWLINLLSNQEPTEINSVVYEYREFCGYTLEQQATKLIIFNLP